MLIGIWEDEVIKQKLEKNVRGTYRKISELLKDVDVIRSHAEVKGKMGTLTKLYRKVSNNCSSIKFIFFVKSGLILKKFAFLFWFYTLYIVIYYS